MERRATRVEAEGDSLGEAKWNAVKQLEQSFPGVTADEIEFEVLSESDPARVAAEVDEEAWREAGSDLPDEPAERVRAVVARVAQALGIGGAVDVEETDEEIRASVSGEDVGILIGKHGHTIDALQHLVARIAYLDFDDERKRVVVDAAGYRERREMQLRRAADRAVSEALRYGRAVELEPMTAFERRTVHTYLRDNGEIQTHSEGDEPDRRLVVTPVRP